MQWRQKIGYNRNSFGASMTPTCRRSYYRSVTPRWKTSLTSLHYGKMQTPPRSPWARNHPKMYDVVTRNKNSHLPAKFPAMRTIDVQTISMRSKYPTTRKRVSPNGTTNTVITAHRLGKVHLTNVVDAEPRVRECTLGTNALHEASYTSCVERRATTEAYAEATRDSKALLADTTTYNSNHITRHQPRIHPRHLTQFHRK